MQIILLVHKGVSYAKASPRLTAPKLPHTYHETWSSDDKMRPR